VRHIAILARASIFSKLRETKGKIEAPRPTTLYPKGVFTQPAGEGAPLVDGAVLRENGWFAVPLNVATAFVT
jgi:hypothetical protein